MHAYDKVNEAKIIRSFGNVILQNVVKRASRIEVEKCIFITY